MQRNKFMSVARWMRSHGGWATRMIVALLALVAGAVWASDGALEINQACATNTGCFAGDAAGYPVTISMSGSYVLSSNLVIDNVSAIRIESDDVGIDMRGFAILAIDCVSPAGPCSGTGTGSGVDGFTAGVRGVSVQNGTVTGLPSSVTLGDQSEVFNLLIRQGGFSGIRTGAASRVVGCTLEAAGRISTGLGSIISDNVVSRSSTDGLLLTSGTVVARNVIFDNDSYGLWQGSTGGIGDGGSVYIENSIFSNGGAGMFGAVNSSASYSTIIDNTVYGNGTDPTASVRDGIGGSLSLVHGNTVSWNRGFGIVGSKMGYRENVVNDNLGGSVSGFGRVNLGANSCSGIATCP